MSRFWPHTPYAEEQPYAHEILYTHVLTRAAQTGTVAGAATGTSIVLLRQLGVLAPRKIPSAFTSILLRSSGVGTVTALGILTVALPLRMGDQEEIQWKDRSWRLLENKGQVEVDDWTYPGMALGLASAVASRGGSLGWRGAVGKVGIGGLMGALGYMGWRYGVNGGKRKEDTRS